MKRTLVIVMLAMLLGISVLAVACGDDETTETTAAPSTETTAAPDTETTAALDTETTAALDTDTTVSGPATGEPIKLGVLLALTGIGAASAETIMQAINVECMDLNAIGGISGRPIELVVVDEQMDNNLGVSGYTKLVEQDGVTAIIGPSDPTAYAVGPLAENDGVPIVMGCPWSIHDALPDRYWSYVCTPGAEEGAVAILNEIKAQGWNNILAVADQIPVNNETTELLSISAPAEGLQYKLMADTWSPALTDVTPITDKIAKECQDVQPDVLLLQSVTEHIAMIVQGLRDRGLTMPIMAGPMSAHPSSFYMGGDKVEGVYCLGPGSVNPTVLPDDYPLKDYALHLEERLLEEYGVHNSMYAANGSDMFRVMTAAMKEGGDDRQKIRDALEGPTWDLLSAPFTYSPDDHVGLEGAGGFSTWQMMSDETFKFIRKLW